MIKIFSINRLQLIVYDRVRGISLNYQFRTIKFSFKIVFAVSVKHIVIRRWIHKHKCVTKEVRRR